MAFVLYAVNAFAEMARKMTAEANVSGTTRILNQSFLKLDLQPQSLDGVFANASMFHVPLEVSARLFTHTQQPVA